MSDASDELDAITAELGIDPNPPELAEYEARRAKRLASLKRYREDNKDKINAWNAEYRNRPEVKARNKEWVSNNRNRIRESVLRREEQTGYSKKYYQDNKELINKRYKERYYKDVEKSREASRARHNPIKHRARRLKKEYNLSLIEYNNILLDQNNKCKICLTHLTDDKTTHVDHCHTSGAVRGILCSKCNKGIGMFNDDLTLLQSAIDYLSNCKKNLS